MTNASRVVIVGAGVGGLTTGAMLAQERLRHKSVKQPFRTLFLITLVLNICGLLLLLTPEGSSILTGIVELLG